MDQAKKVLEYGNEFESLRYFRHAGIGEQEYGEFKFLSNDHLVTDILEELADAANYLRYLYIRVRLMGEALETSSTNSTAFDSGSERTHGIDIGPTAFVSTEKIYGGSKVSGGELDNS